MVVLWRTSVHATTIASATSFKASELRIVIYARVAMMSDSLTTMYCLSSSPANSVPLYLEYKTVLPVATLGFTISSVFSSTLPLPTATTCTRTGQALHVRGTTTLLQAHVAAAQIFGAHQAKQCFKLWKL